MQSFLKSLTDSDMDRINLRDTKVCVILKSP